MPKVYAIDGVIPVVHPTAYVHETAVLIGDVIVGPGCYVAPSASLRGDFGQIRVGGLQHPGQLHHPLLRRRGDGGRRRCLGRPWRGAARLLGGRPGADRDERGGDGRGCRRRPGDRRRAGFRPRRIRGAGTDHRSRRSGEGAARDRRRGGRVDDRRQCRLLRRAGPGVGLDATGRGAPPPRPGRAQAGLRGRETALRARGG